MNKPNGNQQHNYLRKIEELRKAGEIIDGTHKAEVFHDVWCAIYKRGTCDCDPKIEIIKVA